MLISGKGRHIKIKKTFEMKRIKYGNNIVAPH